MKRQEIFDADIRIRQTDRRAGISTEAKGKKAKMEDKGETID